MADPTRGADLKPDESVDVAKVTAVLAFLRDMHQEAAAIVVALETERAGVKPARFPSSQRG